MASSDGWHCPICLGGFERPVLASCCGQSFCRPCLDAALRQVDACPMCRSPLLSGPFSVTPNRALEEALTALASASSPSAPVNEQDDRIAVAAGGNKLAVWERKFAPEAQIARQNLAQVGNGQVPLCVFYVLLFFVFVSFLRVQEEEFSESTNHLRRPH
uniref:RING-type domain-containing protein n=1 Tax=Phytophthora ramorum TaxID=164328 RepID=H3GIT2_PHYRM